MKVFSILCFGLIGFSHAAMAQFTSVPMTINTPYGPVHSSYMIYTPRFYGGGGRPNPKFDLEVTLKNDSIVKCKSRFQSEKKKLYIEMKEGKVKKRIFPADTKSIHARNNSLGLNYGIPADSCWLFRVKGGAINCFSSIPSEDINTAIAIQKGENGSIVALNKENLGEITGSEDEKIVKWLKKDRLVKVIEYYNELEKRNTAGK